MTNTTATLSREQRQALRDRLAAAMPECEGLINYHVGQTLALVGPERFRAIVAAAPGGGANGRVLRAIVAAL